MKVDTTNWEEATMSHSSDYPDSGYHSQHDRQRESFSATPSAIDDLGRDAKKLVNTVNKLAEIGVETTLPLPKLVVVGDQSSGKSSLIEAISEIKVPRSSGKCTACVLKINLRHAQANSWTLRLIQKYFYDPSGRQQAGQDFAQWKHMRVPDKLVERSLQYSEIEERLQRAQDALISPRMDAVAIFDGEVEGDRGAKFSPNLIELDVTGPTVPDLTLFDLPGIINRDPQDPSFPGLVQRLAKTYIDSKNTIVVLACPMNVDPENSTAGSKISEWGAKNRTVGVLTKPDTLTSHENLEQWSDILDGKRFPVGMGYFVTRQPNSSELRHRISHAEARQNENVFFNTEPWSAAFHCHRAKFGTGALQAKLSSLLAAEIATQLPAIHQQLQARLDVVLKKRNQLPKPPANPYGTVLRIVELLRSDLDRVLLGDMPDSNELSREWRAHTETFAGDLRKLQPLIVVNTGIEAQWHSVVEIFDPDDEQPMERVVPVMTPGAGTKRGASTTSSQESPTKRARTRATPSAAAASSANTAKFTLDQIHQRIRDASTSGVPNDTDPRAEDGLIRESIQQWHLPLRKYLSAVHDLIRQHLLKITNCHTQQWLNTGLPQATEEAVSRCFDDIYNAHEQSCQRALEAERHRPFTCNTEGLQYHRSKQLRFLREQRDKARRRSYVNWEETTNNRLNSEGEKREEKASKVKDKDLKTDPHDAEIQVMARVRGYYHLAAGVLADSLGKKSQFEVFEELRRQLPAALGHGLGIAGDDEACVANCKKLLAEDAEREQERQDLDQELSKLEQGMELLNHAFDGKHGMDTLV
ncbi:MAG: hypothetical protein Q9162_006466 [Coniocarpon cinnabarinum]